MIFTATFPIRTVSEANQRGHWAVGAQRHRSQKEQAFLYAYKNFGALPACTIMPHSKVVLELTRVASRKLDKDNLYSAMKHVTDGIAHWLGIDDGDKRFTLVCSQRVESTLSPLVEVRISIA